MVDYALGLRPRPNTPRCPSGTKHSRASAPRARDRKPGHIWLTTLSACGLGHIHPGTHRARGPPALLLQGRIAFIFGVAWLGPPNSGPTSHKGRLALRHKMSGQLSAAYASKHYGMEAVTLGQCGQVNSAFNMSAVPDRHFGDGLAHYNSGKAADRAFQHAHHGVTEPGSYGIYSTTYARTDCKNARAPARVRAHACARIRARVCVCACARARACMRMCAHTVQQYPTRTCTHVTRVLAHTHVPLTRTYRRVGQHPRHGLSSFNEFTRMSANKPPAWDYKPLQGTSMRARTSMHACKTCALCA